MQSKGGPNPYIDQFDIDILLFATNSFSRLQKRASVFFNKFFIECKCCHHFY